MKALKRIVLVLFATILIGSIASAQGKKTETIRIKTSAQCEQCKDRIERMLAYEKGVTKSNLDLKTKIVTVTYKPDKTTPDKICLALSKTGYDADGVTADPKAYKNLPPCCKKPDDPEHKAH
ncbi:MAG: heavy-metal-associated domain-containing protein [Lentimicrobiaceae bacterium]|nr:heavy-metal-associated domain-containing protein [Lentimicrobiaceae bacterium]